MALSFQFHSTADVVSSFRNGSLQLECYNEAIQPISCLAACTASGTVWVSNLRQCAIYPSLAMELAAGSFSDSEMTTLEGAGYFPNDPSLGYQISTNILSCMVEYCEMTPGCTDNPNYVDGCLGEAGILVLEADGTFTDYPYDEYIDDFLSTTTICLSNTICEPQPVINSDVAGIGVMLTSS